MHTPLPSPPLPPTFPFLCVNHFNFFLQTHCCTFSSQTGHWTNSHSLSRWFSSCKYRETMLSQHFYWEWNTKTLAISSWDVREDLGGAYLVSRNKFMAVHTFDLEFVTGLMVFLYRGGSNVNTAYHNLVKTYRTPSVLLLGVPNPVRTLHCRLQSLKWHHYWNGMVSLNSKSTQLMTTSPSITVITWLEARETWDGYPEPVYPPALQ